ncbi:hypothetical protein SAZ10_14120 [Mesorhizobium sp. BAC0120]|uniref:hypothetical protein n=1 Tax=Mesorhizobium sp. BAC0120 TaxID=3090670 RepID=UPI00298CE39B|nr:hypothetical protein [Mesorhizobium sp. BAC0120]MDW6022895.1 hypothetical protein [Mesorhizobium sp. BAC0120]
MPPDNGRIGEFLSAHGGPFYELQLRLKMLREHSLQAGRRAVLFVALAWGVPLLLSLIAGQAFGKFAERPYLLDIGVWARFAIAIAAFTLAEGRVEEQLRETLKQFTRAPLLGPASFEPAAVAVTSALKQRDSRVAEAVCIVAAIALSLLSLVNLAQSGGHSWAVGSDGVTLTAAGWWCLLFSNPFFFFLLLRGLWRHFVWSMLLRRIAALELRLVTTHPDGNAGLAFVGRYPNAFAMGVFGVSCVVAAGLAHQLVQESITVTAYGYVMGLWLILVLALFAYPLLAFTRPLARLKQNTLMLSSARGTQFQRLAERKLLGANVVAADPAEIEEQQEASDPAKQFDATRKMSTLLLDRSALVPVGAAALLPLVAAGATQMPYKELLAICKKLLLI